MSLTNNTTNLNQILNLIDEHKLQEKSVNPTTVTKAITPDSGYFGLSQVRVQAITPVNSAASLTAEGPKVTVPAGYYSTSVSKEVDSAPYNSLTISTTADNTNNIITITAAHEQAVGYVKEEQVRESEQERTVELIQENATFRAIVKDPLGDAEATVGISLKAQSATTWIPGRYAQTISSGTYLTGTQTIKGDTNLLASNIKSGVTIFNVTGDYAGSSTTENFPDVTDWKYGYDYGAASVTTWSF